MVTFCYLEVERDQGRTRQPRKAWLERGCKWREILSSAQQLTAPAALVEDPGSVPRIYLWLTGVCNTSFKISDNSSGPCERTQCKTYGQSTHNTFFFLIFKKTKIRLGAEAGILLSKPGQHQAFPVSGSAPSTDYSCGEAQAKSPDSAGRMGEESGTRASRWTGGLLQSQPALPAGPMSQPDLPRPALLPPSNEDGVTAARATCSPAACLPSCFCTQQQKSEAQKRLSILGDGFVCF